MLFILELGPEKLDLSRLMANRMVNTMVLAWWRYLAFAQCRVDLSLDQYHLTEYTMKNIPLTHPHLPSEQRHLIQILKTSMNYTL